MIQFELLNAKGVGTPKNIGNNKMSMQTNIKVGIIGLTNDPKYDTFKPEFTSTYEWDKSLSTEDAELGMLSWAQTWVQTNYPTIL